MARKYHIWAILLLMVCATGLTVAAQSASQGDSSPVSVTGVVISAIDKEPVVGAYIRLKGTNKGTSTNFDGCFSIKAHKGDTLVMSYLGLEDKEAVVDGQDLHITLMPPKFFSCWSCPVVPVGMYGEVYDQDANRLPGATVTFLPSGKSVTADKKGYFEISEIGEEDDMVRVEHPSYKPAQGQIEGNFFIVTLEKNIVIGHETDMSHE